MKTRFNRKSVCSALILMTVFSMLLSALTFGAVTKRKKVKSMKEYDANGTLVYSSSSTFDSKGNVKSTSWYQNYEGHEYSGKSTNRNTYWKGTDILKKSVEKSGDHTYTFEYNKKGGPKTTISQGPDSYEKVVYKSKGSKPRSLVAYDQNGRKTRETTYDSRGGIKKSIYYNPDGSSTWSNYTTKYNSKGLATKRIFTNSDGLKREITYDKYGNTLKIVMTDPSGKVTTQTCKNKYSKDGYLLEMKAYENGKLVYRDVYKYTSKAYTKYD